MFFLIVFMFVPIVMVTILYDIFTRNLTQATCVGTAPAIESIQLFHYGYKSFLRLF